MKLRRISKKLETEYNKKRVIAYTGMLFFGILGLALIILGLARNFEGILSMIIYVGIGLMILAVSFFVRMMRLSTYISTLTDSVCSLNIEVTKKGILTKYRKDILFEELLFTWDELKEMRGFKLDLNFGKRVGSVYKMASITNGKSHSQPGSVQAEGTQAVGPTGVIVEMYDELVTEIKKYWKKEMK